MGKVIGSRPDGFTVPNNTSATPFPPSSPGYHAITTAPTLSIQFDMVIAVSVGVVLAALLFMRRMAFLTKVELDTSISHDYYTPPGVRVYEIAGPMFFGAAKTAMEAFETVGSDAKVVILELSNVPVIDATGLVALETILDRLQRSQRKVILCGPQPNVAAKLAELVAPQLCLPN